MAIYKCKLCGGDIEITGDTTAAICSLCGATQSLPGSAEPEDNAVTAAVSGENALRSMDEDALTEAPAEEAPAEEVPTEEVPAEDAPTEEVPTDEVPTEEVPSEEVPSEEVPLEEVPSEEAAEVSEDVSARTVPLLEQAVNFLAMNDWDNAAVCCDQVLALQSDNAWAWLGKLMAELNVSRPENLKYLVNPFDESENYKNAVAFADERLREELTGYIGHINERNDQALKDNVYRQGLEILSVAETEDAFREAAGLFESLGQYQDAYEYARECYEKADGIKKDGILAQGDDCLEDDLLDSYSEALGFYTQIPGWRDADEKAAFCRQKIDALTVIRDKEERKAALLRKKKAQLIRRGNIIRISVTAAIVLILVGVLLFVLFTPRRRYNAALELKEAGKYDEAIVAFEALKGYRDSADQITDCRYAYAVGMMNCEQYEQAIPVFEELEDYKDSKEQIDSCYRGIKERNYRQGVALLENNKIVEAYELLAPLGEYRDSAQKAASIYNQYKAAVMENPRIGGSLFLGKYYVDTDKDNGMEDIEWIVLEIKDGRALVVSKYALEVKPLHAEHTAVTWEECALRTWLNTDFFETAFTQAEKERIPTVAVPAHPVPDSKTVPGNDTEDKLFLLSYEEVNTYFSSDSERICSATAYTSGDNLTEDTADAEAALEEKAPENRWWWLRTPGFYQSSFMCISSDGSINDFGIGVNRDSGAVRPAMWIDLN